MLAIAVNLGLHTQKLRKNFGVSVVLEWLILSDSCNCILVDSSL